MDSREARNAHPSCWHRTQKSPKDDWQQLLGSEDAVGTNSTCERSTVRTSADHVR